MWRQKEFFEIKSESQEILGISYSYIQNKGDSLFIYNYIYSYIKIKAFRLTISVKSLSKNKYVSCFFGYFWIILFMYSVHEKIWKQKEAGEDINEKKT